MSEQQMFFSSTHDGEVTVQCRRDACMVGDSSGQTAMRGCARPRMVWLEIPIPYDATLADVQRIWDEHEAAHAEAVR